MAVMKNIKKSIVILKNIFQNIIEDYLLKNFFYDSPYMAIERAFMWNMMEDDMCFYWNIINKRWQRFLIHNNWD